MKSLLSLAALALALAGCGSENKPSAGITTASQGLSGNCPELNGTYVSHDGGTEMASFTFATRQKGSGYEYRLGEDADAQFIEATGQTIQFTSENGKGEFRLSCGANAVDYYFKAEGKDGVDLKFTDLGSNQLRADSGTQSTILIKK